MESARAVAVVPGVKGKKMSRLLSPVGLALLLLLLPLEPRQAVRGDEARPASTDGGLVPLNPNETVLLDAGRKRLVLKTIVCQREAMLEMFLCKTGTKEHEAVLAVDADAAVIHAGLLALGAEPGRPVQYTPEYKPPAGQTIDIFVNWSDESGRPRRATAQSWVRRVTRRYYVETLEKFPQGLTLPEETEMRFDAKRKELIWFGSMTAAERDRHLALSDDVSYQQAVRKFFADGQSQPMEADFVFAGSSFVVDDAGKQHYMAESGNIVCVANFADATIDVTVKSTAQNEELMFEPYTERIPPEGTAVTLELVPRPRQETPESPPDQ